MSRQLSLFIGTFTTLLAIINPFEVLPVYLKLLEGKDVETQRRVAWKSCVYALLLSLFFLIFGTLLLRLFGVPLSMVRIAGGIILMKIGFELFSSSPSGGGMIPAGGAGQDANIAFVPLAMPLMFGPGAIATILGMTSTISGNPRATQTPAHLRRSRSARRSTANQRQPRSNGPRNEHGRSSQRPWRAPSGLMHKAIVRDVRGIATAKDMYNLQ